MPRYRSSGGLDDIPVEDGDIGFLGVNMRVPPWQLQPGMLSLSENGRIDGEWVPRKGMDIVTNESLASGAPLRLPFWIIDTIGGKTVSAASRVGELVTLTVTGHALAVDGSPAGVIVNGPANANDMVRFTAVENGEIGTAISIQYVANSQLTQSVVTVNQKAITIEFPADSPPLASQIISLVNSDPIASALVSASPFGASFGQISAIGPVFLQGGSAPAAFTGLEGITSPTIDPNGSWLMTPTDENTITFSIPGATGSETYTFTSAKIRSVIDDFATGELLGACVFSDPSSGDEQFIFLAYGLNVKKVRLADASVDTIELPASDSIEGGVSMIQAFNKVYIFRPGKVALEWESGGSAFSAVPSGAYTQPQVLEVTSANADVTNGLASFTVSGNSTISAGDAIYIYGATDEHYIPFIGKSFFVTSATSTLIQFYIPIANHAGSGHSEFVTIGKQVSVGGGFIFQPGFPWAIYFQRRLWGPYQYFWDASLTPDGFSSRDITDEIIASDILDGDTYDAIENQYRITGGTADSVVALHPFFDDTLLVLNRNSIHAVSGTVGSLADTAVKELTREIGCLARRSVVSYANSVFFLSDNGVYGLAFADNYNLRGVERPLSANIQPYIDRISRNLASGAVAAYHDNRYWLAIPLDSAPRQGDATGNNALLVYNLLNNEWESVDTFTDPSFLIIDLLVAASGARNDIYAVSSAGGIHVLNKLDEDYDNIASNQIAGSQQRPILARLATRGFMGGTTERKRFTSVGVQMKSGNSQTDVGISFATEDPDNSGAEELASKGLRGTLSPNDTADCRVRVGGIRGFNGSVTIRRSIGRPAIRGIRVSATETNRATTTQK